MANNRQIGYLPENDRLQKNEAKPAARANQQLRQARKKRTWSQGDLAEQIGVAKETISRWENGVSRPQPQQLSRLCETFQLTPEELGYALDNPEVDPTSPPRTLPEALSTTKESLHTLSENTPATTGSISFSGTKSILSRRRMLVTGGIALSGIALGGTLAWFTSRNPALSSSRHWPTVTYDLHHHTDLTRVVQWMLKARQYEVGATDVDGIFGPMTQAAVKNFQKDQHLPEDGVVNSPTWDLLIMPSDPNSRGSQVKALQERLQAFHLLPTTPADGDFGPQTTAAVRRFRQQQHLPVKDTADLDTWCLLAGGTLY